MKRNFVLFATIVVVGVLSLYSCKNREKKDDKAEPVAAAVHNSQNSLDWAGNYYGVMPCADCEGIETLFSLNQDGTYTIKRVYLGKDNQAFEESGKFEWTKDGDNITLIADESNAEGGNLYKVGENVLFALDSDGNVITGELAENYKLKKNNSPLVEIDWLLTEVGGKEVVIPEGGKEPFIRFNIIQNRYSGNGSCNGMFGKYEEGSDNKLTLNMAASTMMACRDMTIERDFFKIFTQIKKYSVQENNLIVFDGEGNKLAEFKKR